MTITVRGLLRHAEAQMRRGHFNLALRLVTNAERLAMAGCDAARIERIRAARSALAMHLGK